MKHMVTYLHTPPLSQGSERDSPKRHGSQATNTAAGGAGANAMMNGANVSISMSGATSGMRSRPAHYTHYRDRYQHHHRGHSLDHAAAVAAAAGVGDGSSVLMKGTSTSPVELVLATCEPSLLHIAPILTDLGILKLEHLRAMGRMSEETRDRELKSIALLRGVTVMEWAILLDKLQTL